MPQTLLLLSLAGALGTLARYGMALLVSHIAGKDFPWGTLLINVLGNLLFGLVWTLVDERGHLSPKTGLVILTGFMGAFTTFSTFAFESSQLLQKEAWSLALANIAAQNGIGILAVFAGSALARAF